MSNWDGEIMLNKHPNPLSTLSMVGVWRGIISESSDSHDQIIIEFCPKNGLLDHHDHRVPSITTWSSKKFIIYPILSSMGATRSWSITLLYLTGISSRKGAHKRLQAAVQAPGMIFSCKDCQVKPYAGGKKSKNAEHRSVRQHVAMFSKATNSDVLDIPAIHTLHENFFIFFKKTPHFPFRAVKLL